MRLIVPALLAVLPGCWLTWEKVDACDSDGCSACTTDDDCVTGYSCCEEALYCMHQDDVLVTCQLGCTEPPPPPCTCQEGRCTFDD